MFGKKNLFILGMVCFVVNLSNSSLALANIAPEENIMSAVVVTKETIELTQEQFFSQEFGITLNKLTNSNIKAYLDYFKNKKIIKNNNIFNFSDFLQQSEDKQIKQMSLNTHIAEKLSTESINGSNYRIAQIMETEYVDNLNNKKLAKRVALGVLPKDKVSMKDSDQFVEIEILLLFIEDANFMAKFNFIRSLNTDNSSGRFAYNKAELGTFSLMNKESEMEGNIIALFHNSNFKIWYVNLAEQNVMEISQWIFDNIEFTFAD
ncbi:hypothetical protein [Gilliamella intestini]|uniref:Uncharacterized protein n=1 Tax=Gilliamella intestini TaxID=1798183 RepID=A0A1C4BKP3_9GAMM|nr:hypothetical protein [Gilliamella intestini]SCC07417.1 hypothetical protein GA0061080_10227 [Gilliamella intestini]